jgi:hypothetical protein
MVGLAVGVVAVSLFFVRRDMQNATETLAEADRLYQAGDAAEAVANYKEAYWGAGGRKADVIQRIVDHEAGRGSSSEAKRWIEKGLDDKLALSFDSPAGRALMATAHQEREAKVRQKRTDDAERDKQRQADKEIPTKTGP